MRSQRFPQSSLSAIVCAVAVAISGCEQRTTPRSVQLCLTEQNDANVLKRVLAEIGAKEGIEFFDWSAETDQQLRRSDQRFNLEASFPIINVAVRRKDGMGIGGGNAGLPANQVVLGFTNGQDLTEAQAFANRTMARLGRTWSIVKVPKGKGAFPLPHCPPPTKA